MGTVVQILEAPAGYNVGSVTAELYVPTGTTQPPVWAFTNPGTDLAIKFPTRAINYASGNLAVDIDWYSTAGSTTGTVTWLVSVTSVAAGSAESIEAATGGTQLSIVSTVNGTAKGLTRATGSVLSANLDSMATGSDIWVEVQRSTGDTTMAGTAALKSITLSYSDGLTGTPGSGDVVGPASSTNNDIAAFDLATGKLIKDSGVLVTSVVVGPASATSTAIVKYSGTTGKLVQDSGITIDASNNVAGMGTLNTRTIANWVDGPASSTTGRIAVYNGATGKLLQNGTVLEADVVTGPASVTTGRVASFNGTTGKVIQDGGILVADVVTGPASVTTGRVASFNGTTGKIIQDAGVLASALAQGPGSSTSGNIASWNGTGGLVLQDSGVSATAHAARHQVGGADSLYSGTFSTGDSVQWNGSVWIPRFSATAILSSTTQHTSTSPAAATLGDITGLSIAIPRAGTFRVFANMATVQSGTAGNFWFAYNYTGTVTSVNASGTNYIAGAAGGFIYLVQVANNALASTTGAGTQANSTYGGWLNGMIVVSTSGTLTLRAARAATSATLTFQVGTAIGVLEV